MSMPLIFGDFAPAELTELTLDRTAMQANPPSLKTFKQSFKF